MKITMNPDQIKTSGSYFSKEITTTANINAGEVSTERFVSEDDYYANAPFDAMLISNNDSVDLGLRLDKNPDKVIHLPAASTLGVSDLNLGDFDIINRDGATAHTAGTIRILLMNTKHPRRD